ncbi:MAG: hypothetical protein ORN51_03315 [Akkermansiaceae bacterium]|nr:hypothetical protein [Akkermansiaceae bacterium]
MLTPQHARELVINYSRYDCVGSRGPQRTYVHQTFERALSGDQSALHRVFADSSIFGTNTDSEAWSEVPWALLHVLGDDSYSAFVASQPSDIQIAALAYLLDGDEHPEPYFSHAYPKTSTLFYARFPNHRRA